MEYFKNTKFTVTYAEKDGHLFMFRSGLPYNPSHTFIATDLCDKMDAFCRWCSKHNNLPNQPWATWDYKGKRPHPDKIKKDWDVFSGIYDVLKS